MAAVKFRVPYADAEALVHEAMISLLSAGEAMADVRAWLVSAVCNGSRHYWRSRVRLVPLPPNLDDILYARQILPEIERIEKELIVRQALARVPSRDREVLYLHYFERHTVAELASRLGTTYRYAEKLVTLALSRLRKFCT